MIRFLSLGCVLLLFSGFKPACLAAASGDDARERVSCHSRSLDAIRTLDLKLEADLIESAEPGAPKRRIKSLQWLRDGLNEHHIEKLFLFRDPAQKEPFVELEPPTIQEWGMTADEVRTMSGWDRDHPFETPLQPRGARAGEYAKVACSIVPRDPSAPYRTGPIWLLLCANYYYTLQELIDSDGVDVRLVKDGGAAEVSVLELRGKKRDERLPYLMRFWLDPNANWMISRIEDIGEDGNLIRTSEVLEFANPVSDVSFPVHVRWSSHREPRTVIDVRVTDLRVNQPVSAEDVALRFPEGARVNETLKDGSFLFHEWGKGAPLTTFDDQDEFREHLIEVRGAGGRQSATTATTQRLRGYIVLVNIVVAVLIAVLLYVRHRWLHRAKA